MDEYSLEIRYLLHQMDDAEREEFGRRAIEDEEAFDRIREAETELYDGYARNALPRDLAVEFEKRLLQTPVQLRRLSAARVLARRGRFVRMPPLALLALAAGVLLGFALAPRFFRGNPAASPLRLSINQTRASAAIPEFRVEASSRVEVRIPLEPGEPGKKFRLALRREGNKVWGGEVSVEARELTFRLEAGVLQPGMHELAVETAGGEPVGFAEFRVLPPAAGH